MAATTCLRWSGQKKNDQLPQFLDREAWHHPIRLWASSRRFFPWPEGIVSVYSRMRNGRRGFYVTSVEAADNLWQRSNSMRDIAKAQAVRIRRIDAEIPRAAAEDIRQVWLRMLRDRRPMKKSRIEFELAGYLRFAIQQPHGEALEAELWLPALGPKTRSLVKISEALWEYCKATPANRRQIASKIDREADWLLAQLK